MNNLNIEIKADCRDKARIREILTEQKARYEGTDLQTDTYFNCSDGRLKLREGNIEYSLVSYKRVDKAGPKRSEVIYYHPRKETPLKSILTTSLGVLVVVKKSREIFYLDNIKFHLDRVEGLGDFVEIEAIDLDGTRGEKFLREQCNRFLNIFGIKDKDLIECSYSDMLLNKSGEK